MNNAVKINSMMRQAEYEFAERVAEIIRKEKIRLAENMLRYSDYEVKEIANYLSFCSQSYFGNIFRKQTGMTPARYRKKYGKWKEQK